MKYLKQLLPASAVLTLMVILMTACSKEAAVAPLSSEEQVSTEIAEKRPAPGVYEIAKFIDTGDDETAQFAGYTFTFTKTGGFTATVNGQSFNGSWSLNGAETVMTLNIAGTPALDNLDDDNWSVARITSSMIRIKANGPDVVTFVKI